jgi:hypothetical protein
VTNANIDTLSRWEWFLSLDFDWEFISGKKKFRWPMVFPFPILFPTATHPLTYQIFYFANRYLLLFAMIGM